jgi:hypothetical protein
LNSFGFRFTVKQNSFGRRIIEGFQYSAQRARDRKVVAVSDRNEAPAVFAAAAKNLSHDASGGAVSACDRTSPPPPPEATENKEAVLCHGAGNYGADPFGRNGCSISSGQPWSISGRQILTGRIGSECREGDGCGMKEINWHTTTVASRRV